VCGVGVARVHTPSPNDDEEIKKNHLDKGVRGGMEEALTHWRDAKTADWLCNARRDERSTASAYRASDTRIGAAGRTKDIRLALPNDPR
jgi:hypothetical protein